MKLVRIVYWVILLLLIGLLSTSQQKDVEITEDNTNVGVYIYVSPDYTFLEPEPEPEPEPEIPLVPQPTPETKPGVKPGPKPTVRPEPGPGTIPSVKPPVVVPNALGLEPGDKLYIRIFKRERKLEIWYQRGRAPYRWFKSYDICTYSGGLGPKKIMGDHKSPEGFYSTNKGRLNPHSNYHLSFNIGYPNRYDRAHGYTGDFIMVHGDCVSVGCYAMTNTGIEEIYRLVEFALNNGQREIAVHIFPFAMTEKNLNDHQGSSNIEFWRELKPAYDIFQQQRRVPRVTVKGKNYVID
jgi:hypothetical protein